ncbi:MAG TPA: aromatic ring-hydroxylating dioxygenase subunit alpha [Candidatus Cybelea sp.]|nr:aromatic ring-hydroxylating dioxygenase subunit alpha [Candidatus Cybelea sp.]
MAIRMMPGLAGIEQVGDDPARSYTLPARAYFDPAIHAREREAVFARAWCYAGHLGALQEPGDYLTARIADENILVIRGKDRVLRGFYNVCQHRAHELLQGSGRATVIACPYHAWTYRTDGSLRTARGAETLPEFDPAGFGLKPVRVETLAGFVFVNLDPDVPSLKEQSGDLEAEIRSYCPEIDSLLLARRLSYRVLGNWKNSVDNFLECYHCHVAHSDFCDLVDMSTYRSVCHGIYSSHCGRSRATANRAYTYAGDASAQRFGSWWLWPDLSIEVFPGAPNVNIFHHVPVGPEETRHEFEFYMLSSTPTQEQEDAIRYIDQVLQAEDIPLVESVQRGLKSRGYNQGRFIVDQARTDMSEHAVHHFHTLVANALAG